jgi:O-antigen ligase
MGRAKIILALLIAVLFLPLYEHDAGATPLYTKAIFLQLIVLAAAALWVPLAVADRRYRPDWRHPLVIASTVWLAANVVAAAFGVDPYRSVWSTLIRMTGVFAQAHLWLYFLMLTVFLRERGARRLTLAAAVIVSVAIGFLSWHEYSLTHSVRVSSALDNAGFLGGYAVVSFWLCLYAALTERRHVRTVAMAAAALSVTTVALSGSRGPLVGLVASLAVVLLAAAFMTAGRRWRWPFAAAVVAVAISGLAVFSWFMTAPGKVWVSVHLPPTASRILYSNVGEDRLALWQIGWHAFLERPWLGWGPENFPVAFDRLVDPLNQGWMLDAGWYDRPHNLLVERLTNLGLVGLLASLFTLAAVVWSFRRRWVSQGTHGERLLLLTLVGALLAYAAHVFFLFEVLNVSVLMLLALALAATAGHPAEPTVGKTSRPSLAMAVGCLVIAAPIAWYGSLVPYRQVSAFDVQNRAYAAGDYDVAPFAAVIGKQSPARRDLVQKFIDRLRLSRDSQPTAPQEWRGLVELGVKVADAEAVLAPHDYRSQLCAAAANRLATEYDPALATEADRYLDAAIKTSPLRLKAFEERGELRLTSRDYAGAVAAFEEALKHTAINAQLGRLHCRLAEARLGLGQVDLAAKDLRAAALLGYDLSSELRLLNPMVLAVQSGHVDQVWISYVEGFAPPWSTRRSVLAASAVIYAKAGERERAEWMLEELMYRDEAAADALEVDVRRYLKEAGAR